MGNVHSRSGGGGVAATAGCLIMGGGLDFTSVQQISKPSLHEDIHEGFFINLLKEKAFKFYNSVKLSVLTWLFLHNRCFLIS